ncbi:GNAT family N-acetyltransferase [Rubrivivax gelatinosus]|uniref:GNAT family N-acetyltransferase n=1 Tax=Rubrivivax gelatinosus TaxID=28068 RepID=UPI0006946B26|nr:GNAT family N-acetyltransferase [Rubrivivax gelatinosus]
MTQATPVAAEPLRIDPLAPADVPAVRALLVAGLTERWGGYEPRFNPDIEALAQGFDGRLTLVARRGGTIVGTGALRPAGAGRFEIVRMSVASEHRRQGVGAQVLAALLDAARQRGAHELVLETTRSWQSAIEFYEQHGFRRTHDDGEDAWFVRELPAG